MTVTATPTEFAEPEPCCQVPAEEVQKCVPAKARLWGFVRRTANEKDDDTALRETDIGLWLDPINYRFLVAAGQSVKDDLAPLEFIQFIRELKHSRSQTLFKVGGAFDRMPRRATPVWSKPVATVIVFPAHLQKIADRARQSGRPAHTMPPPRPVNAAALRRIGAGPIARH